VTFPTGARFKDLLALAHDLADQSRAVIRPQFRRTMAVANKAGVNAFDPVTKADRAAERVIKRAIRARAPEHGILGEEYGSERPDAPFQWVIDPIDGTRSFITGTPMWGTLIGLLHEQAPVLGLMDQPFTGERFWTAEKASYALEAGGKPRRIKTRACSRIADALIMTTSPELFEPGVEADGFQRVKHEARMTRYGGDCYGYCLLAAGFVDLIVESGLKSYDIAPLIPIIEGAGGVVTTWEGGPAAEGGRIVAAGDARAHAAALAILRGAG
jgi:histidinol phosphatase-like enzyme (inositol monophosphatase family)